MIVAAVDDLLFSSKIRGVARQLGVEVTFARTREDVVHQARTGKPSLVIVDLNSQKIDPFATIAALKAEPAATATRVLAFVAHVRGDLVEAARQAGADEVLARSAFAASLPEILQSARRSDV